MSVNTVAAAPALLSREQWRTVRFALWTVLVVAVFAFVLTPLARNWMQREQQLAAARDREARLSLIVSSAASVNAAAEALERQLALQPARVLRARSRALAASALQSLVQDMADKTNVTVTRLDIAGSDIAGNHFADTDIASSDSAASDLPITLAAVGDVYGLTALLQSFRQSRQLVVLDKIAVQVNSALKGAPDVLQMTLSLHAPVIVE